MKVFCMVFITVVFVTALTSTAICSDPLFDYPVDYNPGRGPTHVLSVDVDGDNDLDLVVVNSVVSKNDRSVAILINNGDGTFIEPAEEEKYQMNCPFSICCNDFDGDGDPDLAVADELQCWTGGAARIAILSNDGAGNFTITGEIATDGRPTGLSSTDFNADGHPDIAVVRQTHDDVGIALNAGDGTFPSIDYHAVGSRPTRTCPVDVNHDESPDLLVLNRDSGTVMLLLNDGIGNFTLWDSYALGSAPSAMLCKDFNGDELTDITVVNQDSDDLCILLGNADPNFFDPAIFYPAGDSPNSLESADFDSDGDEDVVIANVAVHQIMVLFNDGDGSFGAPEVHPVGQNPYGVCSADFDGDCDLDLAVANYESESITILHNQISQDIDRDGVGDLCDNCVDTWNPTQGDSNDDGIGDACQTNEWRVEIETVETYAGCPNVTVQFTLYWAEPLSALVIPLVVDTVDWGSFWTPPLPYDSTNLYKVPYQGVTWSWPDPNWADIMQAVRPIEGCETPGNLYDAVPPDNFIIQAQGTNPLAPQPDGWTFLTLEFGVIEHEGWFFFDTACATYDLNTIIMVDEFYVDHGPNGTGEVTFKPGVVEISPCDCGMHCDLDVNSLMNPIDVVIIVNYVYKGIDSREQIPTCPGRNGDWNCDGLVNPVDVVYYVNCVYKNQCTGPCDPCECDPYPGNCPPLY